MWLLLFSIIIILILVIIMFSRISPFTFYSRPPIPSISHTPIMDVIIPARDGRSIGVAVWGYADVVHAKKIIIYFHGCPGSRFETPWICDPTSHSYHIKNEITYITMDRPGYGKSTPHPRHTYRTFTDMSTDVYDVLHHLHIFDIERIHPHIALIGFSSGAHQVHACMSSNWAHHIVCAVLIAGEGPFKEYPETLKKTIGDCNPPLYYAQYLAKHQLDNVIVPAYRWQQYMFLKDATMFLKKMYGGKMMSSPIIASQLHRSMYAVFIESNPHPAVPVWQDLCVAKRGYPIAMEEIKGCYILFQGERDKIRPSIETQHIQQRLKSARVIAHYLPNDNHILHWRIENWQHIVSSIMNEMKLQAKL